MPTDGQPYLGPKVGRSVDSVRDCAAGSCEMPIASAVMGRALVTAAAECLATPVFFALFLDFDIQPLDLLIQGREGDMEALGGVGLVPATFLQHVGDDAALAIFHDLKQRSVGTVLH